jgi:hypothetical protein
MKKYLYLALGLSLLFGGFYFASPVKAESCNPEALVPVSYGQRGSAVRNAQACLMEAGYDIPAGATGYYGEQTRRAVQAFYQDWYGNWDGRRLGPRGVAELKSRLAAAPEEGPSQPSQPSQPSSQDQVSALVAAVLAALQQMGLLPSTSTQQQAAGEEGFLTVEQDPSVVAVTLREGETGKVFGLRMRADNGDVTVQSVFLRWATTSNAAPFRTISKIEVVDEQGNVLFSRNVDNTTFYQDSSLNYYLPVTGLNLRVPKNTYKSLFVQVTVVGTLPSGVNTAGFYVNANDVRGVDGAGVQRFAPSGTISQNFTLQAALAGQADWVVARNVNTPKEGYIFGSVADGKLYNQKVLSFDVTAKYDSLRMTEVSGSVSGNATVTAVYLRYGNQTLASSPVSSGGSFAFNVTPANFTVNKDQTVTLDIYADFANGTTTAATSSVTVNTVKGLNSLGDTKSKTVSVASDVMHYLTVGPELSLLNVDTTYQPPTEVSKSSLTAKFSIRVTPRGGPLNISSTNAFSLILQRATDNKTATVNQPATATLVVDLSAMKATTTVVLAGNTVLNFATSVATSATSTVTSTVTIAVSDGGNLTLTLAVSTGTNGIASTTATGTIALPVQNALIGVTINATTTQSDTSLNATTTRTANIGLSTNIFSVVYDVYQGGVKLTPSGGIYPLSEGQQYEIRVTAVYNNVASGVSGLNRIRVNRFIWNSKSADFVRNSYLTNWVNIQ